MNDETLKLRPSRVLNRLRAGETVLCTKVNPTDPRVVEIAARRGFDCVWIDMLFFGPADFAHSLGKPGRSDDLRIEETWRRIPRVAKKYGKFAGVPCSAEEFESAVEMSHATNHQECERGRPR